jgi:hypothetical protein
MILWRPMLDKLLNARELAAGSKRDRRVSCIGAISTAGQAHKRVYKPDVWR